MSRSDETPPVAARCAPLTPDRPLEYQQLTWGDLMRGTKAQLQALGIGRGLMFPGEPGGPSLRAGLATTDPRGFKVKVSKHYCNPGEWWAELEFPGWPEAPTGYGEGAEIRAMPFAPGVTVNKALSLWSDCYVGTADALVAAGLVPAGCFPGMTGMRKTRVTIYADGTTPVFPLHAVDSRQTQKPGARLVEKAGPNGYRVLVRISDEEGEARLARHHAARRAWEASVKALPRPVALTQYMGLRLALQAASRPAQPKRALASSRLSLVHDAAHAPLHLVAGHSAPERARPALRIVQTAGLHNS